MKKNDIFEIEITGITEEGDGVGRAEGMAVFVPYALMGERVRIIIIKVLKSYAVGKLMEVLDPSPKRIKSECPYFYKCGGCRFWNVDYSAELEYKRKKVEDCLTRIGGLDIEVPAVIGAEETRGYRNKGQFPVSADGIGIYAQHSHRVIDINGCIIQDESNPNVISCVRRWMEMYDVPPYNEETHEGNIRHIYTRCGDSGRMVCVVTKEAQLPYAEELVELLRAEVPGLTGVLQNVNEKDTNVVLGKRFRTLWGKDYIVDSLGDCQFKLSPLSFYQVNKRQAEVLYSLAEEFASLSGKEVVWDLYCGTGTIGQFMASKAKRIVGIEVVPQAIENAKENAKLNGIRNAEYYCGTAEAVAPKLKKEKPDVVIVDPPRKGCEKSLLQTVVATGTKRIVYVSCKPSTLARDLKILKELGYETVRVQPVDLFPRTQHCEVVCVLKRQLRSDMNS